ncbi:TetR family transcriptional regulator [Pseudomonas sp. CFSAN084952]|jgi:TetR/AcrR family transcriptional regulator, transcriptional repressor for nem operon|uniref:TetR/AcrR family transcriptional regulator n=1 Tax=Pseudomonas TaxID=286 RepID=UPI00129962A5|nr:TetR/AcrR family transcriptional regulator [Pseudomonas sp. CFSAN084952]QGF93618.1 TetR family transcriptional regulator [Pseudomonas sp. CFSAN084952]
MSRPQAFNTQEALHKAMVVFWRKGYEATSITDLLGATGLSKSSLYATFGGKRELFIMAFDAYRRDRTKDMHRALQDGPARHSIEAFFRSLFADIGDPGESHGCMSINQAVEMAAHDLDVRQRVMEDFHLIEEALERAIERGQQDGSLGSKRLARELARLLVLAFPGLQVMARAGYAKQDLESALHLLLSNLDF